MLGSVLSLMTVRELTGSLRLQCALASRWDIGTAPIVLLSELTTGTNTRV